MNLKLKLLTILAFMAVVTAKAQKANADSLQVAKTLHELLLICRTVDFADPKVSESGIFYKAAPFIIYRGDDKARNWNDFANYSNPVEKLRVNEVCERLNQTANQDSAYKIIQYFTEKESEGTWYVLKVSYTRKGKLKTTMYAFLKIRNKFGLGDID